MKFRTVADLNAAILARLCDVPRDTDVIVGVPRSGMLPATLLALHLNLPLTDVDGYLAGRLYTPGQTRSPYLKCSSVEQCRRILVIDDSVSTGRQMDLVRGKLSTTAHNAHVTYAAVYATNEGAGKVNLYFEKCEQPRLFEWNFMHSSLLRQACVDIDGVLCRDPSPDENDDGERYLRFLKSAEPLLVPTLPVAYLVTCRLEKYRAQTIEWLQRHGVRFDRLVMMDLPDKAARQRAGSHAAYKAGVYRSTGTSLFIESDPAQATKIADIAAKPVLCAATRRLIHPSAGAVAASLVKKLPSHFSTRSWVANSRVGAWMLTRRAIPPRSERQRPVIHPMHVLWLIPDYYSFLVEEMTALAPRVGRLSVLSQSMPVAIPGVSTMTIPPDRLTASRAAARMKELTLAMSRGALPGQRSDWPKLRRLARHNEVIRRFVRDENVDVIHSHFAVPEGTAGSHAACGRPVVLTLRGIDILTIPQASYGHLRDRFYASNLRRAMRNVNVVTAASRHSVEAARKLCPEAARVRLVPNGLDLNHFRRGVLGQAIREQLRLTDRRVILGAGNLVAGKAFDLLIRAVADLRRVHHNLTLIILGDGPERMRLQELAVQLGIGDSLLLPGKVSREQMPQYFAACDVFVHPSLSEGFGNVVLEAMAMGTALVATTTGAAADLIESGVNGLLVPVGDAAAIAAAVQRLLEDRDLRSSMRQAAYHTASSGFTLDARADAFVELYRTVLCTGAPATTGATGRHDLPAIPARA